MKDYKDKENLKDLYDKYNTQKEVAEVCGCSRTTIKNWMDKFGIETTDTHSNVSDRDFKPVEHEPNTTCNYCGSDFWRKPSLRDGKNFCGGECHGSWLSENAVGENHHQYKRVNTTCDNCVKDLQIVPSNYERVDNNYCDHSCQVEYEDRSGENNNFWKGGKITVSCGNCGEEKKVDRYRYKEYNNFFCDVDCRGEWATENFSGENNPLYEGYEENYGTNWLSVREKVRSRDGGECQICGADKGELGKWPDAHHIVPKEEFDTPEESNFLRNLILLCSTCHGKVEGGDVDLEENAVVGKN